jgi:DNA mismatch repair protein MutS
VQTPTTAEPMAPDAADDVGGFPGILYPGPAPDEVSEDPDYFHDLHLDDVLASVAARRQRYRLEPFLRACCPDAECVAYRQAVFRDLEDGQTAAAVRAFAAGMEEVRRCMDGLRRARYFYEQRWWLLQAARAYGAAVRGVRDELSALPLRSEALLGLRAMLEGYTASAAFTDLERDAEDAEARLSSVRYRLRIAGSKITVGHVEPAGPDYGAEVLKTFERFRQGDGREYRFKFAEAPELNHVEAAVADRVALLFPAEFEVLAAFAERHASFADPRVEQFDREAQFYLAYIEHMATASGAGGGFCYPEVAVGGDVLHAEATFDLALAARLAANRGRIVVNDLELRPPERMVVVTGPNQGGKTTFARTAGQLAHLAALGVPVPGRRATVPMVDGIHTLFEREEAVEDLVSKLEDDLRRTQAILDRLTARSLVVMNETFSSTTVTDQSFINRRVLDAIGAIGAWCVTVTFLDELAALTPATVSMVSTVDPAEPARRSFRIVRQPADGLAYAMAIAEQHQLSHRQVVARTRR